MDDKGHDKESKALSKDGAFDSFVLEKGIFSNIFDKDIRRVYLYKKAERLARAIHLIAPAFVNSPALRTRAEQIALALVDSSVLPPFESRERVSRELLALSSLLAVARTSGMLSPMNADLIARESHVFLEEIASYEEPRLSLPHVPSVAELAKASPKESRSGINSIINSVPKPVAKSLMRVSKEPGLYKGHIKDTDIGQPKISKTSNGRREAILAVLRSKGPSRIKEVSTIVRDISEKTIQRELQAMATEGLIKKEGERRWTTYSL
jgi:hypothetical protein